MKRDTDFLDGIDPDPSFPDVLLDRTVRDAVRLGPEKVHRRASSLAQSIGATFDSLVREAKGARDRSVRSHALARVEACTRAATASFSPALVALLTEATDLEPDHRPDVDSFAERFDAV